MADIVLKDSNGNKQTYTGISKIKMTSTTGDDVFYNEELSKIGKYFVKVIDYDGTVLLEVRGNTGDVFSLPTPPTHDRLVFQEWSCSQDIVDNKITITNNNVMAGAIYTTKSGLSEFDITLTKATGLSIELKMAGTKDWGDGTSDALTSHTYADYGDYTITCDGTATIAYIFGQTFSLASYYCKAVRLANVSSIAPSTFNNCYSLTSVTIPNSVTSMGSYSLGNCHALTNIAIPNSVIDIKGSIIQGCYALTSITIPNSVTNIIDSMCGNCQALTNIAIPNSVTSINNYSFQYCYRLTSIIIPNSVTSIGSGVFVFANSIRYDFTSANTVPTLSNTDTFRGINHICKIVVPDALYDEWIVATNWSNYADYIYKASEVKND